MDRQALLEQKRQRLQELKQRRADFHALGPELAILTPPTSVKVDFAVQVDLPIDETTRNVPQQQSVGVLQARDDVHRFDKAIQTDFEEISDSDKPAEVALQEVAPLQIDQPQPPAITKEETIENALTEQLVKSNIAFHFSDLRLGIKDVASVESHTKEPFNTVTGLTGFLNRPITLIDTCAKFPDLVLVGYGRADVPKRTHSITESSGLAIIFNRKSDPFVPEFFLQCTSPITSLQFSQADPFKIVGGLENGRVVIWDLTNVDPTQIAVLPTLQTTTLASAGEKSKQHYIRHTTPIVSIQQLDVGNQLSSGIVSVSTEGILNLWSPNFLAFPRLDSVKLFSESFRSKDSMAVSDSLMLVNSVRDIDENHSSRSPELRFLSQMVVSSKNGSIYRLCNNSEKHYIASSLSGTSAVPGFHSITSIGELQVSPTSSAIISAHTDWQLRIWDFTKPEPIATIPTPTVVTSIHIRPGHPHQFVSLGNVNPPKVGPCIHFWDLGVKLMSPVATITVPENSSVQTAASFSSDGSQLMVAFANGDLKIWEIDEVRIQSQTSTASNVSIDDGLSSVLSGI